MYEAVGGWGSTKAPGLDGWRPAELKDWPPQLFDLLAAFYGRVEAAGEWPSALSESLVAMLPKGGTRELEDRRPIVLLSVVYRLWGALRASLFGKWLEEAGILPAPGPGRAADAQAYEAALEFELARAKGEPVAGLALDWSKCYDRLPLALVGRFGRIVGVPERLLRPMLAAYGQPRRVLVDGMVGKPRRPVCGLAPGCPAATHWVALVMAPWLFRARRVAETARARAYVDDLTGWSKGEGCGGHCQSMVKLASGFEKDTTLVIHGVKSRRFAHPPGDAARLGTGGPGGAPCGGRI